MTAKEYVKELPYLPVERSLGGKYEKPSTSCIYRWLKEGAIEINGMKPKPHDEIIFPITSLIFFPKGNRRTTML